jgi:hypothetical protein
MLDCDWSSDVCSSDLHVELAFADGKHLTVNPSETYVLSPDVAPGIKADVKDAAFDKAEIDQIVKAIEKGGAIDEQLEDTAAGLGGGGEGEGHDFVRLLRVTELVNPNLYDWGPISGAPLDTLAKPSNLYPPETEDVVEHGNEDTLVTVHLTGSDVDGFVAGFRVLTLPDNGTLYSDAAGTNPISIGDIVQGPVYFMPNANWFGTTSFEYASRDNIEQQDETPATATIIIGAVNDPPEPGREDDPNIDPTTGNYVATTPEDTPVSGQVVGTDVDGDALTYEKRSDPANGSVVVNPDGS